MKIGVKFNILLLSIVLGLSAFFVFYVYQTVENILIGHLYGQLQNDTFHIMDKLDRFLFERHADVQIIAQDPVLVANDTNAQRITQRLIEYRNTFGAYASITFYDKNRVSIADTSGIDIGKTHSFTNYWPDITVGHASHGGKVEVSEPLGTPVLHFAEAEAKYRITSDGRAEVTEKLELDFSDL